MFRVIVVAWLSLALTACGGSPYGNVPTGPRAYEVIPAYSSHQVTEDYEIGPLDELRITVFEEPNLSLEEVPVDASGNILFPLIGQVEVAGRTSTELARHIASALDARYLVDPQVSVIVTESVGQRVTVEGRVEKPGVYEVRGPTTLVQAIAMAEGPTRVAALDEVVVFRQYGDETYAARFDLDAIRKSQQPNPRILGGDTVVVGYDNIQGALREFLTVVPLLTTVFIRL